MNLHSYLELAYKFNPYFGALHASVQGSANDYGFTYWVGYWANSLDNPGNNYIKYSAISSESIEDAIIEAIAKKDGCDKQSAINTFNAIK